MKNVLIFAILVASFQLLAGKAEREKQEEIEPVLKKASSDFKASCGCTLKINVKWETYKIESHMNRLPTRAEGISAGSASYCKKPADKAAICKMKTLDLAFSSEPTDIKFANGTMTAQTNDMLHADWDQMTRILDQ